MAFLNIHTHHPCPEGEYTIPSYGIHPWDVTDQWREQVSVLRETLQSLPSETRYFIGECGLDKLASASYQNQFTAFEAQIDFANRFRRPLILHCVRAVDDLLRLRKKARTPWVFHGFRGNPQQMQQLLRAGIDISFGFRFNEESAMQCPAEHLFLETDEGRRDSEGQSDNSIAPLYATIASLQDISKEALMTQTVTNASRLFF